MLKSTLIDKLETREVSLSLQHILDNSKADSGGQRDINFLKHLVENKLLLQEEAILKRKLQDLPEEYYYENYRKNNLESDRHFLCRSIIQEELKKLGIKTLTGIDAGNMDILRSSANYDIVTEDYGEIMDIGLTPARNYFRGLSETRVKHYFITTYFDDYMDSIIFSVFSKTDEQLFGDALRDFEEGFKQYIPHLPEQQQDRAYYNYPHIPE